MSSTTVNRPAVEVEHASREKVAALMLRAVRDHGLTWPRHISHIEDRGEHGALLDIQIDGRAPWLGWVDFFGEPEYRSGLVVHTPWCGWTVLLSCREAPVLDAGTAALIDEVTAGPGADISAACTCGGEVVHMVGCPGCESDPGRAVRHAASVRAGLVEALGAGPSVLSTYSRTAIEAALTDGVIVEQGRGATGRMVYALAPEPGIGLWTARVDLDAAAQIPVVVVEVSATRSCRDACASPNPTACAIYYADTGKGCDPWTSTLPTRTPGAALVDEPAPAHCRASDDDYTCTRQPVYGDGHCATHTELVVREHVAAHFRNLAEDQWSALTEGQRAALVAACQDAGWGGDWIACFAQATSDPALWVDDARVIVSELDDIAVVSAEQMAEAFVAAVEQAARIYYVPALDEPTQAMPCASVPIGVELIEVGNHAGRTPDDAYGDDAGRDGAEIAHLTGATS